MGGISVLDREPILRLVSRDNLLCDSRLVSAPFDSPIETGEVVSPDLSLRFVFPA